MMASKILIPIHEKDVAPRFDLATEVLIVTRDDVGRVQKQKTVVLPRASADQLCHLIITEGVRTVICSAIEDDYYQYLRWKKVETIDSVIGSSRTALEHFLEGTLKAGDILNASGVSP